MSRSKLSWPLSDGMSLPLGDCWRSCPRLAAREVRSSPGPGDSRGPVSARVRRGGCTVRPSACRSAAASRRAGPAGRGAFPAGAVGRETTGPSPEVLVLSDLVGLPDDLLTVQGHVVLLKRPIGTDPRLA